MTKRGLLFVTAILGLFLLIFVPLARRVQGERDISIDADRLVHTYTAIALYENEHDGLPPANLGLIRRDVEAIDLRSVADPEADGKGPFPLDPFQTGLLLRFPTRVSWSYRYHWQDAWHVKDYDPRQGLLADPWNGSVLTVTQDGAVVKRPNGTPDFKTLFGR